MVIYEWIPKLKRIEAVKLGIEAEFKKMCVEKIDPKGTLTAKILNTHYSKHTDAISTCVLRFFSSNK